MVDVIHRLLYIYRAGANSHFCS